MSKPHITKLWLVMRLTTILLIVTLMQVSAATLAQRVSLNQNKSTLEKIFREIHKQTGYDFIYDKELLEQTKPISIMVKNEPLEMVLEKCLENQSLDYLIEDKLILIKKQLKSTKKTDLQIQNIDIKGKITDATGQGIPGVNILVKGTNKNTSSDANGNFSLSLAPGENEITISSIGFESQTIVINGQTNLNIVLKESLSKMDEVIVIGYGTTTRLKNTGSVGKIKGETLVQQPISNPILAMQGRIPGVVVSSSSGNLGATAGVQIRGNNSLGNLTSQALALYIIDGVQMPSTGNGGNTFAGPSRSQSAFANINSADIESIEVLKDADATAIYGTRGANGVVLITTKKGKEGTTKVGVDLYRGVNNAVNKLDVLNTQEYIQMRKDAFKADGIALTNANAFDVLLWGDQRYTDFQKLAIGAGGQLTNAQFNVQGGNHNTQFIMSLGYRDENGIVLGENNQRRGTARLNLNHVSNNNKFTINSTLTYSSIKTATIGQNATSTVWLAPNLPLTDDVTGLPYFYSAAANTASPLRFLYSSSDVSNYNFIGAVTLGYRILKNLQAKVDASFNRIDYTALSKFKNSYYGPYSTLAYKNNATFGSDYQFTYNVEPQINYNLTIGKGKLTALLGTAFQETKAGGQAIEGRNFSSQDLMSSLAAAATLASTRTTYTQYKFNSIFGRLTYDLNNKYILNGIFRRDGSSRFGPGNKFGNFWAIGTAWIASNESFIKDNFKFVSLAKLRASYGLTGNDGILDYQYISTSTSTSNPYNGNAGLYASVLGNPDLAWEETYKLDVSAELNFFNNRITTVTSFFNNISGTGLASYPLPLQTGFTSLVKNINSKIRNRGVEFELTTLNVNGKDFKWRTNFNITSYRNILVAYPDIAKSSQIFDVVVGKSLNYVRGYEFLGIDPATGTPLVKDQNNDGLYSSTTDYINIGSFDPKFYGGFGNTFSYKGIELDAFFQFTKQPYQYGFNYFSDIVRSGTLGNIPSFLLDGVWREPGQNATRPRLSTLTSGNFYNAYTRYLSSNAAIVDASYIRLKNVSLSYTLPVGIVQKLKLSNVRFYALGQNLWTITKYKGFDPETLSSATPPIRTFTFGVNVSL